MSSFNIDPKLAFEIYKILKKKHPELMREYPLATSFFNFLNSELSGTVGITENSVKEVIQKMVKEEIKNVKSK